MAVQAPCSVSTRGLVLMSNKEMDVQSIGALKINKSYPHPLSKVVLMPCATQPVAFFLQQYSKAILFDYWRVLKKRQRFNCLVPSIALHGSVL